MLIDEYSLEQIKFVHLFKVTVLKGMFGQTIISIISTNLGFFGANSVIRFGLSCSIRSYTSYFQNLQRFPRN